MQKQQGRMIQRQLEASPPSFELLNRQIRQNLKTRIIQAQFKPICTKNAWFYKVVTAFGQMTLIWQNFHSLSPQALIYFNERRQSVTQAKIFLGLFPLIYQQKIIETHYGAICITLMEEVQLVCLQENITQVQFKEMILCAMNIQDSTKFVFRREQYQMNGVLFTVNRKKRFFDFTKLVYKDGTGTEMQGTNEEKCVQIFAVCLQRLLMTPRTQNRFRKKSEIMKLKQTINENQNQYEEVIIVKEKVYRAIYQMIQKAKYWFQLVVWLNLCPNLVVTIVKPHNSLTDSPVRKKQTQIWKLSGSPQIIYNSRSYQNFSFQDGKCIFLLKQIQIEQLREKFFRKNILYVLEKHNNTIVKKFQNVDADGFYISQVRNSNKLQSQHQSQPPHLQQQLKSPKRIKRHFTLPMLPQLPTQTPTDTIVIQQNVQKIECINFFITYFSYITPVLYTLQYFPDKNSLRLHIGTKVNSRIVINLIFHPNYILKDQEISMVIQKCSLEKCELYLRKMNITDSLLLFLANSDKMGKIVKLDLSGCFNLSENGINSLLISPYCKRLESIDLSQLPISETAFESICYKLKKLTCLKLNNCFSNFENVSFISLKLQKLQALGLNLHPNFSDTINILKIDCQVETDVLRNFRNMILVQLKLKLVESKKNLIGNVFGNLMNLKEASPAKLFSDGPSSKTLKTLDLSGSSVKLKLLKPMLNMQSLQTLLLQNYQKPGNQFQHVSFRLLNFSIKNSRINIHQFGGLISKTPHFISLNIQNTDIKKHEIVEYLYSHKKYTNIIQISEDQYTNKLLDSQKSVVECIKVHVQKLLYPESQYIFNHMLYKAAKSKKTLYLLSDQESFLVAKIKKYLFNAAAEPPKNIHINDKSYILIKGGNPVKGKENFIEVGDTKVAKWAIDEPIDTLTYNFVKTIKENPTSLLGVSLYGNKVLGPQAIQMMSIFGNEKLVWIDFRKSLFDFSQVSNLIFQFPFIEKVNEGRYQIVLNGGNFVEESQRNLKFFMRITDVNSLHIEIRNVKEAEIVYSVLYHIIDHHSSTLYQLSLTLTKSRISLQAINFWTRIFQLRKLKSLTVKIEECQNFQNMGLGFFQKLNQMSLASLSLQIPSKTLPLLNLRDLHSLSLYLSEGSFSDIILGKTLKGLSGFSGGSLKKVTLVCDRCANLSNLSKLAFNKFHNLEEITISFEHSPLKQSSIFEFVQGLKQNKNLKKIEINLSFTTQNWNQLLTRIQILKEALPNAFIKLIAVNQTSKDFVFNREQMTLKGVQFIM